ncbi:MAG: hypothetical protein HYU63_03845 [Armatimonadetes bacterium]|nr:hypothetical protein [Armatimonadota bacterium]
MAKSIDKLSEFSLLAKKDLPAAQKSKIKTAYPNNKLKSKLKEAVKNCYDQKSMTYPTYPYSIKNKTDQELKEALLELKYAQANNPKDLKSLQYLLMRWMPALKNKLKINGIFDENTKISLEYFKKIYNLGEDGTKLEEKSAQAFIDIRNGDFWKEPLKYPKTEIGEKIS